MRYDLVVVGAGIVGLGHALAAIRRGWTVAMVDRDARSVGASIRNFGFVTVTGQEAGTCWRRAMRSRDIWDEVAPRADIPILQRGLMVSARRPEAMAVLESFVASETGAGCRLVAPAAAREAMPFRPGLLGALESPHERRVEPRSAIPALAAWLEGSCGVRMLRRVAVRDVAPGRVVTAAGTIEARAVAICPGPDLTTLFPEAFARAGTTLCRLQMLRLAPQKRRLPMPAMSDESLVRYLGYAALPEAEPLRARIAAEAPALLADGIHLIVVQSADGSLIVGDSHHYDAAPEPFASDDVDARILDLCRAVLDLDDDRVIERWTGVYPSGPGLTLVEAPESGVRLVSVTSGTGMSTAFALAEEVVASLAEEM